MSTILKRIGELIRLRRPKQAAMADMTAMEQMPEPGRMAEMMPMAEMEKQKHPSGSMAAVPDELMRPHVQPDQRRE